MKPFNALLLMLLPTASCLVIAQTSSSTISAPTPAPTAAAKPCTAAEHRQFDFWIGDWDVTNPAGKSAGSNVIKPILNGCVLHESWKGNGGFTGESFNAYDASRKAWHQTWVDGTGGVLIMDGRFENGSMTLSDKDLPGKATAAVINEISWTPHADGSVRQHWQVSQDGGKTWATSFDGKYVKSARPQPAR